MKRRGLSTLTAFVFAACLPGCGYRAVYAGAPPSAKLAVVPATNRTADIEAVAGVLAGVRAELSRTGALSSGQGYPRVLVEVLRVDEIPVGIAAPDPPPGEDRRPVARGLAMAVTARAWVVESAGGEPAVDTGDIRRIGNAATQAGPLENAQQRALAVRAAGRQTGEALARRILGDPEPSVEP